MNLHEECLIKYLINPLDLFNSTELLELSNRMLEKQFKDTKLIAKSGKINYTKA